MDTNNLTSKQQLTEILNKHHYKDVNQLLEKFVGDEKCFYCDNCEKYINVENEDDIVKDLNDLVYCEECNFFCKICETVQKQDNDDGVNEWYVYENEDTYTCCESCLDLNKENGEIFMCDVCYDHHCIQDLTYKCEMCNYSVCNMCRSGYINNCSGCGETFCNDCRNFYKIPNDELYCDSCCERI